MLAAQLILPPTYYRVREAARRKKPRLALAGRVRSVSGLRGISHQVRSTCARSSAHSLLKHAALISRLSAASRHCAQLLQTAENRH